jgi:MYXO-CTERM domain-containing protein
VSGDAIYRAAKSPDNYCPPPGSSDYVINDASDDSELPAGIECIALKISDGGPNDYDGLANGIIHLLGAPLVEGGNGGNTITLPEPYDGTIKRKEESLDKLALTDGGGGIGQIGMFGVAGLLLAFALRRRPR